MRLVSLTGQPLTTIETAGLTNHGAALSQDARFLAATTFAADVKVFNYLPLVVRLTTALNTQQLFLQLPFQYRRDSPIFMSAAASRLSCPKALVVAIARTHFNTSLRRSGKGQWKSTSSGRNSSQ